jgi:protein-S-isoprenylcysteine O-methyltransferase Ste14
MNRKTMLGVAIVLLAVAAVLWAWRLLGSKQTPPPPSPEAKTMRPPPTSQFVAP